LLSYKVASYQTASYRIASYLGVHSALLSYFIGALSFRNFNLGPVTYIYEIFKYFSNYFRCAQIPEYCKTLEESEIVAQAFPLIFAFDEIIALGYRESVNLAQIRTFTEMDSNDEKVFQAIRLVRVALKYENIVVN